MKESLAVVIHSLESVVIKESARELFFGLAYLSDSKSELFITGEDVIKRLSCCGF